MAPDQLGATGECAVLLAHDLRDGFRAGPAGWVSVSLAYSPATGSLAYSLNGVMPAGWRNEGLVFRVKSDASAIDGRPTAPLQKLTLPGLNRMALTTDSNEVTQLRAQGWMSDGTLGYIGTTQTAGTQPLHRVTHDALKLNLYTTKAPTQYARAGKFGWRYAGVIGYVMPATDTGSATTGAPPSMTSTPVSTA